MPSLIAPVGAAFGVSAGPRPAAPAGLAERGLRRAGVALLRWADDWRAWRLRRAEAESIGLAASLNEALRRDMGLPDGLHDAARSRQTLERLHGQAWR